MKYLIFAMIAFNSFAYDLKVLTEHYPPFQYDKNDSITGISTEITNEIFKRAKIKHSLSLVPWKRAYDGALNNFDTCVYSTSETPERLKLFKWVGPLVVNRWVIIGRSDTSLKVNSLADIKNLRVGGYDGDAISDFLKGTGQKMIDVSFDYQNALKLSKKRLDVWATSNLSGLILAKEQGVKNLKILHTFNKINMSLACNKSVPDEKILLMNKILNDLETEGFVDHIFKKHGVAH